MGKEGRSNDLILSFMSLAHWQIFQFMKEEKFWIKEALKMNQLRIQMQSKPKSKVYYILKFKHELGIKNSLHMQFVVQLNLDKTLYSIMH